jgi:uncharacterized membrane protein
MPIDSPDSGSVRYDSERLMVLLSYGLFLIAPAMGGLTCVIAIIIAHVRLAHAAGTWLESHYRNQIRVFWTMLVYALALMVLFSFGLGYSVTALLWPFSPGWPFWTGFGLGLGWAMLLPLVGVLSLIMGVWYYWRMLSGFVRALDDRAY